MRSAVPSSIFTMKSTPHRKSTASSHDDTINTAHVASSPLRSPPLSPPPLSGIHRTPKPQPRGGGLARREPFLGSRPRTAAPAGRSRSLTPFSPTCPLPPLSPVKFAEAKPSFTSGCHDSEQCAQSSRPVTHTGRGWEGGDPAMGCLPPKSGGSAGQGSGGGVRPTPLSAPPGLSTAPPQPRAAPHRPGPGRTCGSKQIQRPGQHGG